MFSVVAILGFLKPLWNVIKSILFITIPLPIVVFIAIGAWWYIDRTSAIKHAVKAALVEFVAGTQLAAQDALIKEQSALIADQLAAQARQDLRLAEEAKNKKQFEEELADSEKQNNDLLEKLNAAPTKVVQQPQQGPNKPSVTICPVPLTPRAIIDGLRR